MLGQTNYHLLLRTDYSYIFTNKQFFKDILKFLKIFYFDNILAKPLAFFRHAVYAITCICKLQITYYSDCLVAGTRQVYESMEKEFRVRDVKNIFLKLQT